MGSWQNVQFNQIPSDGKQLFTFTITNNGSQTAVIRIDLEKSGGGKSNHYVVSKTISDNGGTVYGQGEGSNGEGYDGVYIIINAGATMTITVDYSETSFGNLCIFINSMSYGASSGSITIKNFMFTNKE